MRIAVGGFQHETNTFAPLRATLADFEAADAWPGLVRGPAMLEAVRGINLPIAGFIAAATQQRHTIVPLTWCSATPSAHVTRHAYEHIADLLLQDLRAAQCDAAYLDLHGAMVAEHVDDADGELLRRVRACVGARIPVVASLDFHANVSQLMVAAADALCSYRTYPHVDMADTGARTYRALHDLQDRTAQRDFRQLDFLMPLTSQCTLVEPLRSLMASSVQLERGLIACNLTPGFPAADVIDCAPAIFAFGHDADAVRTAVQSLAQQVSERESEFGLSIYSIDQALREIKNTAAVRGRPIVLADTQDNPGGGGNADTTSLIKALLDARIPALVGVLCDPAAATRAHTAGVGGNIELNLGAGTGFAGETPIAARFDVIALGDGQLTGTGPFYQGARMALGPMALLRTGTVTIAVASKKQQAADQAMFRHLRCDPSDFAVLALKSSVHFRADFGAMASRVLVVDAPGPNIAAPDKLPFRNLRSGVRTMPRS
jgi:microcystin degradation protein MlrC